jgi:ferredoxin
MKTGPRVRQGFDLALTELLEQGVPHYVLEAGSSAGEQVLAELDTEPATDGALDAAEAALTRTAQNMGRTLDTDGIKELLYSNLEHPRWEEVAQRCLACTNCTLVCPTCFCTTVEDTTDLDGNVAERRRRWDSCFTPHHSHVHGGSVHGSIKGRYRQWLTHKVATWIDQFDTSGCVGCGRCITWCPVGIDITEEVAAIRASPHSET